MKIALNLLYLIPGQVGGTETYARGLIDGLAAVDSANEYIVYTNEEAADWPLPDSSRFRQVVCPVHAASRNARYWFEQMKLPALLRSHRVDLVHSLGYVGPLFSPCPSVVTIHDTNFASLKGDMPLSRRVMLGAFVRASAYSANHVITGSHFSKREILRYTSTVPENIEVVHLGPKAQMSVVGQELDGIGLAERYGVRGRYVVAFTGYSPHKNTSRLIQAFSRICSDVSHSLVILGGHKPDATWLADMRECGLGDRVIATGYVPNEHVLPLLRHSDLFVLPSTYEGFGLPVLEAQQVGVPIVCSTAGSLPEIAGDGAFYCNPLSVGDMAEAMRRCLSDEALSQDLVAKGNANLSRFSWARAANETLEVYRKVLRK